MALASYIATDAGILAAVMTGAALVGGGLGWAAKRLFECRSASDHSGQSRAASIR